MKPAELMIKPAATVRETEPLRVLRTNFLRAAAEQDVRSVLIASDYAQEAARTAVRLACALIAVKKTVLLVDLDRQNACLRENFRTDSAAPVLNDYFAGKVPEESLICPTNVEGLSAVFAEASETRDLRDDLLTSQLVSDMKRKFDFVFLLATPDSQGADVFSLDETADAVSLFVRRKATRHSFLKRLLEYYARCETKVLGIVMM